MKKNFIVSNTSLASNPGNAQLNPFVWFLHNFTTVSYLSFFLVIEIYLTIKVSYWIIILAILALVANIYYWIRRVEHFRSGDSNGGIVISLKPTLIAVTTDMTKGFGTFPIIKIMKYKALKNVKLGDRLATVALYTEGEDENLPYWVDFDPIPLSFATNNKEVIQRAMNTYDEEHWNNLESRIREIKKPYKEGLYKVEKHTSDWKTK